MLKFWQSLQRFIYEVLFLLNVMPDKCPIRVKLQRSYLYWNGTLVLEKSAYTYERQEKFIFCV